MISAGALTTATTGQWLTGNALMVNAGTVEHAGVMQGNTLTLTADALNNSGVLNGLRGTEGILTGQLTNVGQIQSGGGLSLTANDLISAGRIVGIRSCLRQRRCATMACGRGERTGFTRRYA